MTPTRRTHLYVSARSTEEGCLWAHLEHLSGFHPNLRFQSVVTRDEKGRATGRRLPQVLQWEFLGSDLTGWEVHAAGPEPFVEAMRLATTSLSATDVYADAFAPA